MFDFVFGLPMHALVIHAVVVLVPLSALSAMAYVARPAWRGVLRWPTAAGAVVSGVSAFIAAESGEALLARVSVTRASTTDFDLLSTHTEAGNRARTVCLLFMVLALVMVYLVPPASADDPLPASRSAANSPGSPRGWRRPSVALDSRGVQRALGAVTVLCALAALVTVVIAGHAGSAVVWSDLG